MNIVARHWAILLLTYEGSDMQSVYSGNVLYLNRALFPVRMLVPDMNPEGELFALEDYLFSFARASERLSSDSAQVVRHAGLRTVASTTKEFFTLGGAPQQGLAKFFTF